MKSAAEAAGLRRGGHELVSKPNTHETILTQRVTCAYAACLSLGIALLAWGLAPGVIERIVTGQPPRAETLYTGILAVVVGSLFVGFYWQIRRRARWAMWCAFLLSLCLLGTSTTVAILAHTKMVASFLLILTTITAYTTWSALHTAGLAAKRRALQQHAAPSRLHASH